MTHFTPVRVGLDIGATGTTAITLVDGRVRASAQMRTGRGPAAVAETARAAIDAALAKHPADVVESIGIGVPGQVLPGSGVIRNAVNLQVVELDLGAELSERYAVPVSIDNDVRAAALGAYAMHVGHGSFAYLNLGTGVAAGIVQNGVLLTGQRGVAGEIGHLSVDPAGPECRCGQRGCIEALCGGGAITARWPVPTASAVRDIFDGADRDDAAALLERGRITAGIAAAVRVLGLAFDVDQVMFGGGVASLGRRLVSAIATELKSAGEISPFLAGLSLENRISVLPAGSLAAPIGAAMLSTGGAAQHTSPLYERTEPSHG